MNQPINAGSKKTILHIVISFETGGLERFVLDLIRLSAGHFDHRVVCLERSGALVEAGGLNTITCLYMKPGLQLKPIFDLCSIIKAQHIDLIHTHNEKALFYGAISGLLSGIPVVHTKHGKNKIALKARLRNNLLARLCKKTIAVSRDAALQCIDVENISPAKVVVILNGVDINAFSYRKEDGLLRDSFGIAVGIPIIGIVARLAEVKDHATLFQACNILTKKGTDFRLVVVGDGPLKGTLKELAESLGLRQHIIFTGARHDIPGLMNMMDIFVLSSISEGISLTLIESMACELPVIATSVGGNPEVVVDGETGFLVPSQDPEAMAQKIMELLKQPHLRKSMGRAGRTRVEEVFSIQKAVQKYENLYKEVMKIAQ